MLIEKMRATESQRQSHAGGRRKKIKEEKNLSFVSYHCHKVNICKTERDLLFGWILVPFSLGSVHDGFLLLSSLNMC